MAVQLKLCNVNVFDAAEQVDKLNEKQDDDGDESDDDKYAINLSDDENDIGEGGPKTDTDGLPFACFICRDRFTQPVVTMCKHYFCSACALEYAKQNKTKNCALCGKNTSGVFNHASKLARKIALATK